LSNGEPHGSSSTNGSTYRPEGSDSIFAEATMVTMNESPHHEAVGDVLNRLSPKARRVLDLAADEARVLGASSVCCHHVLLGILREGNCGASRILDDVGFDYEEVRRRIVFITGRGQNEAVRTSSPALEFSPRLNLALDSAGHEATKRGQTEICTVHLLIAMLRTREGLVVVVLDTPGLGLEPVGSAVVHAFRAEQALDR
jgi:ATP-dependent Clp protease ATP-binding subunit ClpC